MKLIFLGKYSDFGLLLLRVGIGVMYLYHGFPKIMGGPEKWTKLGSAMQFVGVSAIPVFWGFMAAVSEFGGALLLIAGLFFRPACIFLAITMAVAASMHLGKGDGLQVASHAIENGVMFVGLLFIGPGRYSLDRK